MAPMLIHLPCVDNGLLRFGPYPLLGTMLLVDRDLAISHRLSTSTRPNKRPT